MRLCTRCGIEKPLSEFSKKKESFQSACKSCHSKYHQDWYIRNREMRRSQIRQRMKDIRSWVKSLKVGLFCSKCGEDHPATLQFHHRDPSKKDSNLANIYLKGWSKERIMKEIEKCDILCANCHFKLHSEVGER